MDMYCGRCRRALMARRKAGAVTYAHMRGDGLDGHEPEPVPVTQIERPDMNCDFCSQPRPANMFRLTNLQIGNMSTGQWWMACDGCAAFVQRRDLAGLIRRVVATYDSRHREAVKASVEGPFALLLAGPVERYPVDLSKVADRGEAVRAD